MLKSIFQKIKSSLLIKDELCGEWDTDDGTGFVIIMGSWMEIRKDGTGSYRSWSEGNDDYKGYSHEGEFYWKRIGDKKITIQKKGSTEIEEIEYEIKRINNRIELISKQEKMKNPKLEAFWKFAQTMFRKK